MARVRTLPAEPAGPDAAPRPDETPPIVSTNPPRRRKPSWVILGVVLVGVAALLGAYVFTATTEQTKVLVAAHELPPGEPVGVDDLRVIEVGSGSQLRAIRPEQQDLILGLTPRGRIPAGTLLNTELFIPIAETIPAGYVVVGGSFGPGAVPASRLAVGDRVQLVEVAPEDGGDDVVLGPVDLGEAEVWALDGGSPGGASGGVVSLWVSLLIPAGSKMPVTQAIAGERLRMVLTETS